MITSGIVGVGDISNSEYSFEQKWKTNLTYHTFIEVFGFNPANAIIEVPPAAGSEIITTEDILATIALHGDSVAVVLFSGVNYYSGQVFDMEAITAAAHEAGAYAGFDLAHAAGNIELKLHDWNVDFACWCNYKYLNRLG